MKPDEKFADIDYGDNAILFHFHFFLSFL